MMELVQIARGINIVPQLGSVTSACSTHKSKVVGITIAVLLGALILIGGFFVAQAYKHPRYEYPADETVVRENIAPVYSRRALPQIKWDGSCPRKAARCPQSYQGAPPLLVISLDGFHSDYLKRGFTPTLNKIAQCGTKADFLYSVFPSKTFPNHYSIITGLYPASHGIIDNSIYEPFKRKMFKVGDPEMRQPYWYEREPIWATAEKQGKKTASLYWVGTDAKINGTAPTYSKTYASRLTFDRRVDQVLEWISLPPATRPRFLTLYVNQPDNAAHKSGTKSQQVNQALSNVDKMIARLYAGLQSRNLIDCVNIVILSDHGMTDTDCKRSINIQQYMNVSQVFATMGPFGRLRPKGRRNPAVVKGIVSKLNCKTEHMRAYEKEQLPVRMHYADNARIEPIFLDMDNGWTVLSKGEDGICTGAAHGYDNLFPDMTGLFIAQGPSIKKHLSVKPFINIELYEMFCELIGINPNPNNGTKGSLHHILRSPRLLSSQVLKNPPATSNIPKDEMEYNFRVYAANCSCSQSQKQVEIQDLSVKNAQHLPFGVPHSLQDNRTLRLLYNEDYVLAYDLKYRIPMWAAFTLDGQKNVSKVEDICWTGDARIPISDTAQCGDYSKAIVKKQYILQRPLYPPSFSYASLKEQASYVSNSIPKSLNHTKILEKELNEMLRRWAIQSGQLNVIMGPAFDLLANGIRPDIGKIMRTHENYGPLIVPTHIFVITTWCSSKVNEIKDCIPSKLNSHAFLLPNKPYPLKCEPGESAIKRNVARVVDVESLTALSFFNSLPTYDAIRLRTMMSRRPVS